MTLGDEEATRRRGPKTVLERKGPSTFSCGAEIVSKTEVRVHPSLEATVDAILAGGLLSCEVETVDRSKEHVILIQQQIFRFRLINLLFWLICWFKGRLPNVEIRKINSHGVEVIVEKKEPSIDVTTLDKKHEEETLDVSKLTKEETISEVLPTKEITETESSEKETPVYLYVYGVTLE